MKNRFAHSPSITPKMVTATAPTSSNVIRPILDLPCTDIEEYMNQAISAPGTARKAHQWNARTANTQLATRAKGVPRKLSHTTAFSIYTGSPVSSSMRRSETFVYTFLAYTRSTPTRILLCLSPPTSSLCSCSVMVHPLLPARGCRVGGQSERPSPISD